MDIQTERRGVLQRAWRWLTRASPTQAHDASTAAWHEAWWRAAARAPDLASAALLRQRLASLALTADEKEIEEEMQDGLEAAAHLADEIAKDGLRPVATGHRAVGNRPCFFSAPVTLADDPAHPPGTLLLTDSHAIFVGGGRTVSVAWHALERLLQQDRDVVLVARPQQLHRLRCNSFGDALKAAVLVRTLAGRNV